MEFVAKFIYNLLRHVKTYNKLSKSNTVNDFYQPYFRVRVYSPYGSGFSDEDNLEGIHINLTILLEPMSEDCEVLNNTISFIITDDEIKNIIFNENGIEHLKNDLDRNPQNCEILLSEIREYCEKFLGNKEKNKKR
jgi:hypothetical protein